LTGFNLAGRCAESLESGEDQVEAPLELGGVVVAAAGELGLAALGVEVVDDAVSRPPPPACGSSSRRSARTWSGTPSSSSPNCRWPATSPR
jgi:hypothetical protein